MLKMIMLIILMFYISHIEKYCFDFFILLL